MSFWDKVKFWNKPKLIVVDAVKPQRDIVLAGIKKERNPVLAYIKNFLSGRSLIYEYPEYDLNQIGRLEDVESYIARAHSKKVGLMFKAGWGWTGKNQDTIEYLDRRIRILERAMQKKFTQFLIECGSDFIRTHNVFVLKVTDRPKIIKGREIRPVKAYFRIPAETIKIAADKFGNVTGYRQEMPNGEYKDFSANEIIHFVFNRKAGFRIGTPALVPVFDDVRALRRTEERVEGVIDKYLYPWQHITVGTENAPAKYDSDGTHEVDKVREQIENMAIEGGLVTSERVKINIIGSEGQVVDATPYLQHFKLRVFSGMDMSALDFGEANTANRSTSDTLSGNLVDNIKFYQMMFMLQLQVFIIEDLLLENSTESDPLSRDNLVEFKFREIDQIAQIKEETNALNLYQGNAITESEMRTRLSMEPVTEEQRKEMHYEILDKPLALIKAVDEMLPGSTASSMGKTKNAVQPTNQHGKNHGPDKRKSSKESWFEDSLVSTFEDLEEDLLELSKQYNDPYNLIWYINTAASLVKDQYGPFIKNKLKEGIIDAGWTVLDAEEIVNLKSDQIIKTFENDVHRLFDKLSQLLVIRMNEGLNIQQAINSVCDSIGYRAKFIHNTNIMRARNLGLAIGFKMFGYQQATSVPDSNCPECYQRDIDLSSWLDIASIPPWHPNCKCILKAKDGTLTPKVESCVMKVKSDLREKHPDWDEKKIKVTAIKICRSSINE